MLFTLLVWGFLVSPAAGASVSDCTSTDSQLYGGLISWTGSITSMADCVTLCQAYDGCSAVVYRKNYNRCFMKKCGYADATTRVNSDALELCCLTGSCDTCKDSCDSSYPCTVSTTVYCTGLPDSWTNAETTTSFSVTKGTTVSVTCADGYSNTGDSTVTCVSGTTFTNEPNCVKDCYAIPDSWTNAETTSTFNITTTTEISVTCADGYSNTGDSTVTCVSGTTFTDEPDCVKDCYAFPDSWTNAETTSTFNITSTSTVDITCDEGYTNYGNSTVTCVTEKEWVDAPSCQKDWFIDVGLVILVCLLLIVVAGVVLALSSMGAAVVAAVVYAFKEGGYIKILNHENCPE